MEAGIRALFEEAGIRLAAGSREYRSTISLDEVEVKILKPQNIVEMLHFGSRDMGFAGADWVAELQVDVVEVLDTGLDAVRVVAAAPSATLPNRRLRIASEMEHLTRTWIAKRGLDADFVRSYGATEVFPPEDADCIVDITATGATLAANGLTIIDDLLASTTRFYASRHAWDNDSKRERIEAFAVLLRSVIDARQRVMIEVNVGGHQLEHLVAALPCMREPTIAPLHGDAGFAVKAAVPRSALPKLVTELKARGGTDIVVSKISQIVS
jgi:ATP phosphoribosyltransferase